MNRIKELTEKIEQAKAALKELAERIDSGDGEWSAEDRQKATEMLAAIKKEQEALERVKAELQMRDEIDALLGSAPDSAKRSLDAAVTKSIGDRFVESQVFNSWLKSIAPNGVIADSTKGITSPPFTFASFKEVVTGGAADSGGAMVFADRAPMVDLPVRPLTIRDIVTNGRTTSDTIEFVRVTTLTSRAAAVPEATAAAGSGLKPESGMVLERVTATVRTIAHWLPATKRALADAAQLRTMIDNFLRSGLEEALETQMIAGDGVGENFVGIGNAPGTQVQPWDTDALVTTRRARTRVTTVGRATPTAYLLNPADWETLDLMRDNEARYYFGGPQVLGTPRLWGLPVVQSEAVPAGLGYVGDFRTCVLWDREQASIQVSDSHADFFTRNLVAILGEMRAGFGVLRPSAIVEIDLTAA